MTGSLEVSLESLPDWLRRQGVDPSQVDFTKAMKACAVAIAAETKRCFDEGRTPDGQPWRPLAHARPRGDNVPLRNNGLLMASVSARGKGHIEQITPGSLVFGTNLEYAWIHQEGGEVRPTQAKLLAIPLTVEASRAGRPRLFRRELFVLRRGDRLFLAESDERRQLTIHYILVPRVVIPPRPFLGLNDKVVGTIENILLDHAAKAMSKGK